jgi:mRNA interferase MazF
VLSRNVAIERLRRAIIAPCTSTVRGIPSEVLLEPGEDPIPQMCVVNLDSIENVGIGLLTDRIGRLNEDRLREICGALEVAVDCV